ncbi:MAG: RtcB family protein [Bacillota bacterium]
MKDLLKKAGPNRYQVTGLEGMHVDVMVYLSKHLFNDFSEGEAVRQLVNGAMLPGACFKIIGLPDIHTGFGLPIGGVMATHAQNGVVSAGAVGMDINCGVRLLATRLQRDELDQKTVRSLLEAIEDSVPIGVGKRSRHRELNEHLETILAEGAREVIRLGYGQAGEGQSIEEGGCLAGADPAALTAESLKRSDQLSTLGGGNHFIEIGYVARVFNKDLAARFGLEQGVVTVMMHTGSRGLGHQICTDFSKRMVSASKKYGISLPDKGLACAPIDSPEGKAYLGAMACAVNFAFANRQLIAYNVRQAFTRVLGKNEDTLGLSTVYDVAHNIAKFETHHGAGVLVHRKGATRALPPGHPDNPPLYRATGHPAIIPGSMGTASYVVVGTEKARETFCSVNHGAGRVLSRTAARKAISREQFRESMGDIVFNRHKMKQLLDEAPGAYKPIAEVVDTLAEIGITDKVVEIRPLGVIKGEDG